MKRHLSRKEFYNLIKGMRDGDTVFIGVDCEDGSDIVCEFKSVKVGCLIVTLYEHICGQVGMFQDTAFSTEDEQIYDVYDDFSEEGKVFTTDEIS